MIRMCVVWHALFLLWVYEIFWCNMSVYAHCWCRWRGCIPIRVYLTAETIISESCCSHSHDFASLVTCTQQTGGRGFRARVHTCHACAHTQQHTHVPQSHTQYSCFTHAHKFLSCFSCIHHHAVICVIKSEHGCCPVLFEHHTIYCYIHACVSTHMCTHTHTQCKHTYTHMHKICNTFVALCHTFPIVVLLMCVLKRCKKCGTRMRAPHTRARTQTYKAFASHLQQNKTCLCTRELHSHTRTYPTRMHTHKCKVKRFQHFSRMTYMVSVYVRKFVK